MSNDLTTYRNASAVLFVVAVGLLLYQPDFTSSGDAARHCPPCKKADADVVGDVNNVGLQEVNARWQQLRCESRSVSLSTFQDMPPGFITPTTPPVFIHVNDHATQAYLYFAAEEALYSVLRILSEKDLARPTIIDVGSGYGTFAIYAAKLGYPTIAVEPDTSLRDFILESAETNEVALHKNRGFFQVRTTPIFAKNVQQAKSLLDLFEAGKEAPFLINLCVPGFEGLVIKDSIQELAKVPYIFISVGKISPQLKGHSISPAAELLRLRSAGFALVLLPGTCDSAFPSTERSTLKGFPFTVITLRDDSMVIALYNAPTLQQQGTRCIVWAIKSS